MIWRSGSQIARPAHRLDLDLPRHPPAQSGRLRAGGDDRRRAHLPRSVQRLGLRELAGPRRARPTSTRSARPSRMLILMNGGARRRAARRGAARRRLFPPADGRRSAARPGALLSRQPVQRARPRAADAPARVQAPGADRPRRRGAERGDRARLRARRARRLDPGRGAGDALVRARDRLCRRGQALADPAALPLRRRRRDAALRRSR